ncbi:MAG: leucine-rich repeat protein, partial [Clostridia bacterium]|nr:leucine-rich repeat protein [Clostridia bacterium]
VKTVTILAGMTVGNGAFRECKALASVTVGDNVTLGADAFRLDRETNFTELPGNYRNEQDKLIYYYIYTSALHELTIGKNVVIGNAAFMGAAELESVTLGDGAVIGDSAFYNTPKLTAIDLSKAVSIGASAFSGDVLYEFADQNMSEPAIDANREYLYRYYAPALTSVDLSAATFIGEDAFAYCRELVSVTLGSGTTRIPARAFNLCIKLSTIDLSHIEYVGDSAFNEAALVAVDLSAVMELDKYAFVYNEQLTTVTFGTEGVVLGEGAFAYCAALATVNGSAKLSDVGAYAFAYTAVCAADLSNAVSIGDGAYMKESLTPFDVTLGDKLTFIGENPFAMCVLKAFESTTSEEFNGETFVTTTNTFDISESVKVIDGMLYRVVPSGLEFITYAGDSTVVVIAEGTVRITAQALAGSGVVQVQLPSTLKSIGHKAFYDCSKLTVVAFTSYEAPILEEEYDYSYWLSAENLPATGEYQYEDAYTGETLVYEGLGIVPYFMWNATDTPAVIYYGATFSDYIGHVSNTIVMVKPSNGLYYDSFIYDQYFALTMGGAPAADQTTLDAIAAIDALPDNITLAHKELVAAARAAYAKISSKTLQDLVYNYTKLSKAEDKIKNLEYIQNEQQQTPEQPDQGATDEAIPPVEEGTDGKTVAIIVLSILLGLVVAAVAVFCVLFFLKKGPFNYDKTPKEKTPAEDEKSDEESKEASDEENKEASDEESEEAPAEESETEKKSSEDAEAPEETEEQTQKAEEDGQEVPGETDEKDNH